MSQLNIIEEMQIVKCEDTIAKKRVKVCPSPVYCARGSIGSRRSVQGTLRGASVNAPGGMRAGNWNCVLSVPSRGATRRGSIIKRTQASGQRGVSAFTFAPSRDEREDEDEESQSLTTRSNKCCRLPAGNLAIAISAAGRCNQLTEISRARCASRYTWCPVRSEDHQDRMLSIYKVNSRVLVTKSGYYQI